MRLGAQAREQTSFDGNDKAMTCVKSIDATPQYSGPLMQVAKSKCPNLIFELCTAGKHRLQAGGGGSRCGRRRHLQV